MSVGEVAATLYYCHLLHTENFKYPSPDPVKITSEPKYSQSHFEFIQSLLENAELWH